MDDAQRYDIGIAGAGVAGLACAALLARAGHRVTVFDQFAAPQATGSGLMLQPVGLSVLSAMGIAETIAVHASRIDRLLGRSHPSGRVVLDVRYASLGRGAYALGVQRTVLFLVLLEAAIDAGATLVPGARIVSHRPALGDKVRLVTRWGQRAEAFDLIVDALGARSVLSPEAGEDFAYGALWASLDWPEDGPFDAHGLEQRYERATRMAGLLPVGMPLGKERRKAAFFWSMPVAAYEAWRETPLDAWKAEVRTLWPEIDPLLGQIVRRDQMVFATYLHRTLRQPGGERIVHVGDSWHSTSPQLGQGANTALLDAWALAASLDRAGSIAEALARFHLMRRRHVRFYQGASRLATPAYQSDGSVLPWIRDRLAGPLSRIYPAPWILARLVGGGFTNPYRAIGLKKQLPPMEIVGTGPPPQEEEETEGEAES